jgi:hypothetical protein
MSVISRDLWIQLTAEHGVLNNCANKKEICFVTGSPPQSRHVQDGTIICTHDSLYTALHVTEAD